MKSIKIKSLIRKLFNKESLSKEDTIELNQWYNSLNESDLNSEDFPQIKGKSWEAIQKVIDMDYTKSGSSSKSQHFKWLGRAAVFLCICAAGFILMKLLPEKPEQEKFAAGIFTNDAGKITSFVLPDGSKVWLSSGSKLSYVEDFPNQRQVGLIGEAFFEVVPNPNAPFEISTGKVKTEVLGTSFNLKHYDSTEVILSVYSGRVKFAEGGSDIDHAILTKGEKISWTELSGLSEIELFDTSFLPDWRQGKITFDNADLNEIQNILKRWYDVEIQLVGSSTNCHYSGEFTQASLEQILETITYTLNLTYQINEENVTIRSNPCN